MNLLDIQNLTRPLSVIAVAVVVAVALVILAIRLFGYRNRPTTGVHSAAGANFRSKRIKETESSRLQVVRSRRSLRFNFVFLSAGLLVFGLALVIFLSAGTLDAHDRKIMTALLATGTVACLISLLMFLLPWRFILDKDSEELIAGNIFVKHKYPFAEIQSVKIVKGDDICHGEKTWDTYECRLLIYCGDGSGQLELGMWRDADREATREMAKQLASFLEVAVHGR